MGDWWPDVYTRRLSQRTSGASPAAMDAVSADGIAAAPAWPFDLVG
ncbi:hypothetical protein [Mesorhizobium japonicum]|nr:hypothetical protein [Mesorhizobium japonicum]